ncbi:MAG: hypothetical protein QXW97_02575 [Candidatus Pacearchaeota archaeon]
MSIEKIFEDLALIDSEIRAVYKGISMENFQLQKNEELKETPPPHYYIIVNPASNINRTYILKELNKKLLKNNKTKKCIISEWPISPNLKNPEIYYPFLGELIWKRIDKNLKNYD